MRVKDRKDNHLKMERLEEELESVLQERAALKNQIESLRLQKSANNEIPIEISE